MVYIFVLLSICCLFWYTIAQVAPHPFTTIEPNIAPGWYLSPEPPELDPGIHVAHGRDPGTQRRLLPVIIKDVAGLVPGAYKGRGKGNRFLADLCDADVLVHVIDATGRSDVDGNILVTSPLDPPITSTPAISVTADSSTSTTNGNGLSSSPSKDAQWIREELHRWIFNNVKAKWNSVCRKGLKTVFHGNNSSTNTTSGVGAVCDRVVAIFTGYKGPRSLILKAAKRAQFDINRAHLWSKYDVHCLVAHYLCLRFPVCLALNKIDLFTTSTATTAASITTTNAENHESVAIIRECQIAALRRGEVAVPVSAACEAFRLSCEANNLKRNHPAKGPTAVNNMSKQEGKDWEIYHRVMATYGSTGVLTAVSSAVRLRPPVLCYPVADLDSEAPIVWQQSHNHNNHSSNNHNNSNEMNGTPRLRDCILLKPGSTVGDVYTALKRGVIPTIILQGELVRAEGRSLDRSSRRRQVGRDTVITADICVLRIQTNRKSVFKQNAS